MARAEEKLVNLEVARQETAIRLTSLEHRTGLIERLAEDNAATLGVWKKLFWVVFSALSTALVGSLIVGVI